MVAHVHTAPAPLAVDMDALTDHYAMEDQEAVRLFLVAHPPTVDLLMELPAQVKRIFGREVPIRLAIYTDHEEPQSRDLYIILHADISTNAALDEAENNLRRLHKEWLVHLPRSTTRNMNFDLEYR